jgi:hypothetical protein
MSDRKIVIDGVTYVRSRYAAHSAHLALEYVSRLARAQLINGKLVNGLWFVKFASLEQFLADQERQKEAWRARLAEMRREEQRRAGHPSALFASCMSPRREMNTRFQAHIKRVRMIRTLAADRSVEQSLESFDATLKALTAIGALSGGKLAYFDWEAKQYKPIPVSEQVEVAYGSRRRRTGFHRARRWRPQADPCPRKPAKAALWRGSLCPC